MTDKLKSLDDLKKLREKAREEIDLRCGPKGFVINVHLGTCGIAAGARDVLAGLAEAISESGAKDVTLRQSGCAGLCSHEPMLTLTDPAGVEFRYGRLDRDRARTVIREHVVGGHPVDPYFIQQKG